MSEYRRAIENLQRAALAVIEALPKEKHEEREWATPLIVAAISGGQPEHFIAKIERWPANEHPVREEK